MDGKFIALDAARLAAGEHICCAFGDKKSAEGYAAKRRWLEGEFPRGYIFRRLDERAKVFIEYGPAECAWVPVEAAGWLMLGCFWVSGRYKGQGYARELLAAAVENARRQGRHGILAVVGVPKFHFLGDPKWLLRQGFEEVDALATGFRLLALRVSADADDAPAVGAAAPAITPDVAAIPAPRFADCARSGECPDKDGLVAYYSDRCPFTRHYVEGELAVTADARSIPLKLIKLETAEQARACPSPATIFSLFYRGRYLTNDLSATLESRFDKLIARS